MIKFLLLLSVFFSSCDEIENTPELLNKLRTIGVATDQGSYTYSTDSSTENITLTFYIASNLKEDIEVSEITLENEVQMTLSTPSVSFVDYTDFRFYTITATSTIPLQSDLEFTSFDNTSTASYALLVRQGNEEERIKGRVKIYQPGESIVKPSISIESPNAADSLNSGTIALTAALTTENDENYRIGWFVTAGKIEKRRGLETEWEEVSSGTRTIIVTVRGLDSGNFHHDIREFTVN